MTKPQRTRRLAWLGPIAVFLATMHCSSSDSEVGVIPVSPLDASVDAEEASDTNQKEASADVQNAEASPEGDVPDTQVEALPETSSDGPTEASTGGKLGAACEDDTDCGADGSVCIKATDESIPPSSGPAGGYCSFDCKDFWGGTVTKDPCVAHGGYCKSGWCYEKCKKGVESATKCHGRPDTGCMLGPYPSGTPAPGATCIPICGASSDCGPGRVCDPMMGRCVAESAVSTGDGIGAYCTSGMSSTCAGLCAEVEVPGTSETAFVCSRRCVMGFQPDGCGPLAACIFGILAQPGTAKGDAGYCAQLCDTAEECLDKVHQVACDPSTKAEYGHGYCKVVGLPATVEGGTDAAQDAPSE